MTLSLPPYTRAAALGLTLALSVLTTVVAVAPAGAAPVSASSTALSLKGLSSAPRPFVEPTPEPATPAPVASTPEPVAPVTTEPVAPVATPPVATPPVATPPVATPPATVAVTPTPRPTPRPTRTPHPVTRPTPTHKPAPHAPSRPSGTPLARAIAAIPGYFSARPVQWVRSSSFGHLGMTDWYHNTIYLSPSIPGSQLASVAKHEYGHILEARAYGGDIPRMIAGISRVFGGGGRGNLNGTELAADCIAIVNGASWTHYTGCNNATWRAAARQLIAGREI